MRKSVWIAGLAVPVMIAIVLLFRGSPIVTANPQEAPSKAVEVKIDNFSFGPQTLTVAVGTTVIWINHDDDAHKVVSNDDVFKSKVLDTGERFSYTFTKAGNYSYFCSIHPKMTGAVAVK